MTESVVLPEQGQTFQLGGTGVIFKLLADQTNGAVALVEHIVAPGTLAAPPHTHQNEDEISYILEGELTIQVGESFIHALANTLIMKPRGIQLVMTTDIAGQQGENAGKVGVKRGKNAGKRGQLEIGFVFISEGLTNWATSPRDAEPMI